MPPTGLFSIPVVAKGIVGIVVFSQNNGQNMISQKRRTSGCNINLYDRYMLLYIEWGITLPELAILRT